MPSTVIAGIAGPVTDGNRIRLMSPRPFAMSVGIVSVG
jgi:hypothetical protein